MIPEQAEEPPKTSFAQQYSSSSMTTLYPSLSGLLCREDISENGKKVEEAKQHEISIDTRAGNAGETGEVGGIGKVEGIGEVGGIGEMDEIIGQVWEGMVGEKEEKGELDKKVEIGEILAVQYATNPSDTNPTAPPLQDFQNLLSDDASSTNSFVHPMKAHQPTTTVHRAVPGNAPVPRLAYAPPLPGFPTSTPRTLGQPTIFVPNQTRQPIIEEPLTRAPATRICYTCNKLVTNDVFNVEPKSAWFRSRQL